MRMLPSGSLRSREGSGSPGGGQLTTVPKLQTDAGRRAGLVLTLAVGMSSRNCAESRRVAQLQAAAEQMLRRKPEEGVGVWPGCDMVPVSGTWLWPDAHG